MTPPPNRFTQTINCPCGQTLIGRAPEPFADCDCGERYSLDWFHMAFKRVGEPEPEPEAEPV